MTWRVILLPRAEQDLADDVKDVRLRERIVQAAHRVLGNGDLDRFPIAESPLVHVASFYVAGTRGPIIVYASFVVQHDMVLVRDFAFDDADGQSLGRPPAPRM